MRLTRLLSLAAVAVTATLTGATMVATPAAAQDNADTINKSVIQVKTEYLADVTVGWSDGPKTYNVSVVAFCTGFFVSDVGHVITAGHCLEASPDINQALSQKIAEYFSLTKEQAEVLKFGVN